MFENPRKIRQARNFTKNVPKILDLNIVLRTDIFRKLTLGAPDYISILYHNSVISTKNSKNWVTCCASLQSLNCNFDMQHINERPKQFPIDGQREDCIP